MVSRWGIWHWGGTTAAALITYCAFNFCFPADRTSVSKSLNVSPFKWKAAHYRCLHPADMGCPAHNSIPRLRPCTLSPVPAQRLGAEATRCTGCRSGPGGTAGGPGNSTARPQSQRERRCRPAAGTQCSSAPRRGRTPCSASYTETLAGNTNEQRFSLRSFWGPAVPHSSNRDTRPHLPSRYSIATRRPRYSVSATMCSCSHSRPVGSTSLRQ
jgi:hypothetical protein